MNGLVLGSSYALVALGLLLVFGVLDIPNFAHGELFMVGALSTAGLASMHDFPFVLAALTSVLIILVVAFLIDRVAFRPLKDAPHTAVLIASLAASQLLIQGASLVWGTKPFAMANPLPGVLSLGDVRVSYVRLLLIGVVLLGVVAVAWLVKSTSFGRQMRALAQNGDAALLVGINVPRVRVGAFLLGCVLAGAAGALLAGTQVVSPSIGFQPTLIAFFILIVAGAGSIWGVVAGAFVVGIIETFAAAYIGSHLRLTVVFAAVFVFLMVRPEGALAKGKVL